MPPRFVIVSGPPASGKSTLAPVLAARLGLPLFAKDTVKEALVDVLGAEDVDASRRLGHAAIHTLIQLAIENGCGVLESNWRASVSLEELRRLDGPVVEVFCECDPAISRARYQTRAVDRHAAHFDLLRTGNADLWSGDAIQPVDGGWPVIRVDTDRPVNIEDLGERVAAGLTLTLTAAPITTQRLELVPLEVGDADEMVRVLADPELCSFIGGEPPTLVQLRDRYSRLVAGHPTRLSAWLNWIVRLAPDRTAVGSVQAEVTADFALVAWTVGTQYRRRCIASEAAAAVVQWLVEHDIDDVRAYIHPDHAASIGVARRIGLIATDENHDGEVVWRRRL